MLLPLLVILLCSMDVAIILGAATTKNRCHQLHQRIVVTSKSGPTIAGRNPTQKKSDSARCHLNESIYSFRKVWHESRSSSVRLKLTEITYESDTGSASSLAPGLTYSAKLCETISHIEVKIWGASLENGAAGLPSDGNSKKFPYYRV
jgi:hypothetical protein